MKTISVFVKEMPRPVRYISMVYITALLLYNGSGSYMDAKEYLNKYRENTLSQNARGEIKSEWEAVKYGASLHSGQRLWDSIIWPVTLTNNIIPWLVLTLNSK